MNFFFFQLGKYWVFTNLLQAPYVYNSGKLDKNVQQISSTPITSSDSHILLSGTNSIPVTLNSEGNTITIPSLIGNFLK